MIKRRMIGAAAGALILGGLTVAVAASPVQATGRCQTLVHTDSGGIALNAGATAVLGVNGVVVSTPDIPARARWVKPLSTPVKMSAVTVLSYQTHKLDGVNGLPAGNDAALPAYTVTLDVDDDGTGDATLIYEPYYQIVGNPARGTTQTWDVLAGKFWTSTSIPGLPAEGGGSYAGNKTWAEILAANPEARVVAFGWQQGTYNAGTVARLNHVTFAGTGVCHVHDWKKGPESTPSQSVSPSPSVSPTASASASASPSVTETAAPGGVAGGDEPSLPVTGVAAGSIAGGALVLLAVGGVLFVLTRKRRTRYVA